MFDWCLKGLNIKNILEINGTVQNTLEKIKI